MPRWIGALLTVAIASAIAWADGLTVPFSMPATTCSNQFVRSIAVSTGVGTCATVAGSDMTNNTVGNTQLRQGSAKTVIGVAGNATANVADIGGGAADNILRYDNVNTGIAFGAINLAASGAVGSSILPPGNGGTGIVGVAPTSWTPADGSGAGLSFTGVSANYTQIGNMVFAYGSLTYPATADGTAAKIQGFPIAAPNQAYARQCNVSFSNSATGVSHMNMSQNAATAVMSTAAGASITNVQMSLSLIIFLCIYPVT